MFYVPFPWKVHELLLSNVYTSLTRVSHHRCFCRDVHPRKVLESLGANGTASLWHWAKSWHLEKTRGLRGSKTRGSMMRPWDVLNWSTFRQNGAIYDHFRILNSKYWNFTFPPPNPALSLIAPDSMYSWKFVMFVDIAEMAQAKKNQEKHRILKKKYCNI